MRSHLVSFAASASALFVVALVAGCAAETGPATTEPAPEPGVQATQADNAALQTAVATFTRAVVAHDAAAFESVASDELLAHVRGKSTVDQLLVSLHGALQTTFHLATDEVPAIALADVIPEGDGVRVTLTHDGEAMPKSFYFVRQDGALKLNLAAPGFSKAAPDGALFGKDNYTVHNVNIPGNQQFALACSQGSSQSKTIIVKPQQTVKVACENTCGLFSGSTFGAPYGGFGGPIRKCDWNWFGDDVRISLFSTGGWDCVSYC